MEEGAGYVSLLESQAYTSHEAIAIAFGKPKSRITECIGFTRLSQSTKDELLKTGVKNRALLRQLLTLSAVDQIEMIREASGKEEVLESLAGATDSTTNPPSETKKKTLAKPFVYKIDKRGVSVPGFKWKKNESKEGLQTYIVSLRRLLEELESLS
jgi:hypothetical protein